MNVEGVPSLQSRYGFARRKLPVNAALKTNNSSPKISRRNNLQDSWVKNNSNVTPLPAQNKTAAPFSRFQPKSINIKSEPKFGFRPGIANNNEKSKERFFRTERKTEKVDKITILPQFESDHISSSDISQESDNYNSDISTSDTSESTNNNANNNTRPFSQVNYKGNLNLQKETIPTITRYNHVPKYSPKPKRVNEVPIESSHSRTTFLKKPSSGPSPYKSANTRASKPIVTLSADSLETETRSTSSENSTITSSSLVSKYKTTLRTTNPPSHLPGIRASFFNSNHQKLNSASLHSKTVNAYQKSEVESNLSVKQSDNQLHKQKTFAFQKPIGDSSLSNHKKEPSLRSFVQHKNKLRQSKIDDVKDETVRKETNLTKIDPAKSLKSEPRKWVKKFEPKGKQYSSSNEDDSVRPIKGVDYLSMLRSSNHAIVSQHNVTRTRLESKISTLPVIPQETPWCDDCLDTNDESLIRTPLSPNETEDDSGIFTSSHSKYSLESLQEERASPGESCGTTKSSVETMLTPPSDKMSHSLLQNFDKISKIQELQNKYARVLHLESTPNLDKNLQTRQKTKSVTNSSDSEELCSRETSPMQLLDELFKSSSDESMICDEPNLSGIVKERKVKFEAKLQKSTDNMLVPVKTYNKLFVKNEDSGKRTEIDKETPRRRHFADLKNSFQSTQGFHAISKINNLSLHRKREHENEKEKEVTQPLIDTSDSSTTSSSLTSVLFSNNQIYQHILNKNSANIMSTSTGSNYSNCHSENKSTTKTTPSPSSCSDNENKDFLIDDDYNDQQELTFYGHDDSLDESLFEKVDSMLMRKQETQETDQNNEKCQNSVQKAEGTADISINDCASPIRLPRLEQIKRESVDKPRVRQDSLDTLSGQESIGSDDCMLDFDERQMQEVEEVKEKKDHQPRIPLHEDLQRETSQSRSACDDLILDEMTQEVLDVKSMLSKLKTILLEAGTANPTHPTNLYANIVTAEADLITTATDDSLRIVKDREIVKDIPGNVAIKAVEENQDLKRQLVFLQQQLVEKDRRINILETLVADGGSRPSVIASTGKKNSASQI
eukprot:GFUD01000207.1.p1 GENE.GFUD01000207.1~~GFUD01000207.1.p1  ORF type:complete len:1065 (+),score=218.08 GFUD01000207.1:175-3369(+)